MEPFGSGTYRFDCTVNGIGMKMLFDTGASSVSLSLTTAKYLIENGYLEVRDIKGHSYSQIADGSTVPKLNAIINDIGIGSVHIKNVSSGDVGYSIVRKKTLDGPRLTIEKTNYTEADLQKLSEDANIFINTGNYSVALNNYMRISNVRGLDDEQMYNVASSHYNLQQYEESIAICSLLKDGHNAKNERITRRIVHLIAENLSALGCYKNAISCYELLLNYGQDSPIDGIAYLTKIALLYGIMKDYDKSITYIRSAVSNYRRIKGVSIQDIQKGYVKDDYLGSLFHLYGNIFLAAGWQKEGLNMIVTYARCGYMEAIQFCKDHTTKY